MVWRPEGWEMTAGTPCSRRLCVYFILPSCYRYASVNYKLPYMNMSCLLSYIVWEYRNNNQKALQFWCVGNNLNNEKPVKMCFDIQAWRPQKRESRAFALFSKCPALPLSHIENVEKVHDSDKHKDICLVRKSSVYMQLVVYCKCKCQVHL